MINIYFSEQPCLSLLFAHHSKLLRKRANWWLTNLKKEIFHIQNEPLELLISLETRHHPEGKIEPVIIYFQRSLQWRGGINNHQRQILMKKETKGQKEEKEKQMVARYWKGVKWKHSGREKAEATSGNKRFYDLYELFKRQMQTTFIKQ